MFESSNAEDLKKIEKLWGDKKLCEQYSKNCKDISFDEAKILRQANVLEKGMSLKRPKNGFGVKKALELLEYIADYEENALTLNPIKVRKLLITAGVYESDVAEKVQGS